MCRHDGARAFRMLGHWASVPSTLARYFLSSMPSLAKNLSLPMSSLPFSPLHSSIFEALSSISSPIPPPNFGPSSYREPTFLIRCEAKIISRASSRITDIECRECESCRTVHFYQYQLSTRLCMCMKQQWSVSCRRLVGLERPGIIFIQPIEICVNSSYSTADASQV